MTTRYFLSAVCLASGLLLAAPTVAADLLAGSGWALLTPSGDAALQPAPGGVLRVTVKKHVKDYYQIQLTHDVAAALPAGTIIRYHFQACSPSGSPIHAVIEKRTAPYTRVMDQALRLAPAWKDYSFTTRVPAAYGPRGLAARLQVGQTAGTMEFRGLSVSKG